MNIQLLHKKLKIINFDLSKKIDNINFIKVMDTIRNYKDVTGELNDIKILLKAQDYYSLLCLINTLVINGNDIFSILKCLSVTDINIVNSLFFDIIYFQYGLFTKFIYFNERLIDAFDGKVLGKEFTKLNIELNVKDCEFAPYLSFLGKLIWLRSQVV